MSQNISQYIEQQLEAARAKKAQAEARERTKLDAENASRKAQSLINTLRGFSLLGIEASESDLSYSHDFGWSLKSNNFRMSLQLSKSIGGINSLVERDNHPSEFSKRVEMAAAHRVTYFKLSISRSVPEDFYNEDNEISFYVNWSELSQFIEFKVESEIGVPLQRIPDAQLAKLFEAMTRIEDSYQTYFGGRTPQSAEKCVRKTPRFSYEGDSREEILAALLEDIRLAHLPEGEY